MARLGGGGGGQNAPVGSGPASPRLTLVPGSPLAQTGTQPFRVRAIGGAKLCAGAGVIRMIVHTANDGNAADGNGIGPSTLILQELDSQEVIFYQTLAPSQLLTLYIPFHSGLLCYQAGAGIIIGGQFGVSPLL